MIRVYANQKPVIILPGIWVGRPLVPLESPDGNHVEDGVVEWEGMPLLFGGLFSFCHRTPLVPIQPTDQPHEDSGDEEGAEVGEPGVDVEWEDRHKRVFPDELRMLDKELDVAY